MANIYIINTNKGNNPKTEIDMLENEKCAAYYSPWKHYIDNIEPNDLVFLYSNGKGIIARGIATGVVEINDYEGKSDEEHYMYLNRFEQLDTALEAANIKEILSKAANENYDIKWNQTMIQIPYHLGLKVWQHITKHCI